MPGKVYLSTYKNRKAVTLESEVLKVQFLPELGGKMASLVCKKNSMEFLAQAENTEYKVLKYDGSYVDSECSGFDDMFPTIDTCYYDGYPWTGVKVPDHGEVCGLPWSYSIEGDSLYMSVYGVRFPYKFEKWAGFGSDNVLNIKYKVTNLSNFDMDFIWAAHPMVNIEEGGEILLPYGDNSGLTCVFSWDEGFGKYGDTGKWPELKRRDGSLQKLNISSPRNQKGNNYKYYFNDKIPEGWCAYRYKSSDTVLTFSFPPDRVPYLSIWVNEGSFHGFHNIAMEPCTGAYDRIDLAKIHKQNSVLKAKSEYSWFFNFHIEQFDEFERRKEGLSGT